MSCEINWMKIEKYFFAHSIFFFFRFGRSGSVLHISTYQIGIPIYLQWKIGIQRLLTKWHILRKNQRPSLTARNYFYLLHSSLQLSINIEYAHQRACLYSIEMKLPLYHKLHSVMSSSFDYSHLHCTYTTSTNNSFCIWIDFRSPL